jgi:hypothetical protein
MSLDDLLQHSKSGAKTKFKKDTLAFLEESVEEFFWGLNSNRQYEESTYGGEIERGFHPSALMDLRCVRKLIYDYFNVPVESGEVNPKLRRIFDNGHHCHSRWQTYFTILAHDNKNIKFVGSWKCKSCGFVYSPNIEIEEPQGFECPFCKCKRWKYNEFRLRKKSLRVTGKRDGKLIIKGKPYLLEIKSMSMFQFTKLYAPIEKHIKQFSFYMWLDGTKEGFFLIEDKNTQDVKLFHHKFSMDHIKGEIAVLTAANKFLDEMTMPGRLTTYPQDNDCKRCGHKHTCKKDLSFAEVELLGVKK